MRPPSPGVTLSGKVRIEQVNRLTVNICFELCPPLCYFVLLLSLAFLYCLNVDALCQKNVLNAMVFLV